MIINTKKGGAAPPYDSIQVTERDADGKIASAVYTPPADGEIKNYTFAAPANSAFRALTSLEIDGEVVAIGDHAFDNSAITDITPENWAEAVVSLGKGSFYSSSIKKLVFNNLTGMLISGAEGPLRYSKVEELIVTKNPAFLNDSASNLTHLKTASFGSVGYGYFVKDYLSQAGNMWASYFRATNCETLTFYTRGTKVDSMLTNFREGFANAIITVKACEDTTYNGIDYAAGDTILVSEVVTT